MTKKKDSSAKNKGILICFVGIACLLLGMVIAHCVWYFAVLGLVESDINASLLVGNNITGTLNSTERYEDGYLAHIDTEDYGEVTIKISVDTARSLKIGTLVQIVNTLDLVEKEKIGDADG